MRPQRRPQVKLDVRVPALELVARGGQVALEVHAGREEIRESSERGCAPRDASIAAARADRARPAPGSSPRRSGSLPSPQAASPARQVSIGSLLPAAVRDQEDGSRLGIANRSSAECSRADMRIVAPPIQ